MAELWGWQKSLAIICVKSNCLAFFQSLTGCNNTSFLLGREKGWVSFPAITGYFVKLNSLPEKPPTDYLCTIERFITVLYGRTSKHLHEHRHGYIKFINQKVLFDEMTALTKYGFVTAHFKGSISRHMCKGSALEHGK